MPDMSSKKRFLLQLICCGRDHGIEEFDTWDEAHEFRESYTSGVGVDPRECSGDGFHGHTRAAVLTEYI